MMITISWEVRYKETKNIDVINIIISKKALTSIKEKDDIPEKTT